MSGNDIWQELISGNKRFAEGNPTHPNQSMARRQEMAKGQNPRAAVLACADSRVSRAMLSTTLFWEVSNMRSSI